MLDCMHELGITESILNIALAKANEAKAGKILHINLVIGELSGFVPDCIQFYFDFLGRDTAAEGAGLHFELVPTELRCRDCNAVFHGEDIAWSCPTCGRGNVEICRGREFYIESLEVE
ncbi:MAG: hydrogenase maturation nickel metallochaperone HypA [Dehalococcoidia bacterium]